MMNRLEIVSSLLSKFDQPRYLEIGVGDIQNFGAVVAHKKVGVFPRLPEKFNEVERRAESETVFSDSSDHFFSQTSQSDVFDVIFIDGHHTFDQSLRDTLNATEHLSQNGVIVVDDVVPSSYYAAIPDLAISRAVRNALGVNDKSWMGDVYKLPFFIAAYLQPFSYVTVEDSHGVLLLWRQQREEHQIRRLSPAEIGALDFSQTVLQREMFNFCPWAAVLERLR